MRFGKDISITSVSVQAVLDTLFFAGSVKPDIEPLLYLFVVDQILLNPAVPKSDKGRLYIIQSVLTNIIAEKREAIQDKFDIILESDETLDGALHSLQQDVKFQSDDLLAWSILYNLYVQVDLGLSVDNISTAIGVTSRTLRRYRNHGVELLTHALWQREITCRKSFRYRRILAQLQPFHQQSYVGNQTHYTTVFRAIADEGIKLINVRGEQGIGKTSFVKHCILGLVEEDLIDDVFWISNISSVSELEQQLRNHFLPEDHNNSIQDIFTIFNCVIVLDGIDDLLITSNWDTIYKLLSSAIIFTTCTEPWLLSQSLLPIYLRLLNRNQSTDLVKKRCHDIIPDHVINEIVTVANGNPKQLVHLINVNRLDDVNDHLIYLSLPQILLLLCIPKEGMLESDFQQACKVLSINDYERDRILKLREISTFFDKIYYDYFANRYEHNLKQVFVNADRIITLLASLNEPWLIVLHLLDHYARFISSDNQIKLIKQFWRKGIAYGNKVAWHSKLLQISLNNNELWIQLALAVSYKSMAEYNNALIVLTDLINLSGVIGDFGIQSQASLELIKFHRMKGQYQVALKHLDRLKRVLQKFLDPEQFHEFLFEQVQLAIDTNQLQYALSIVESLPSMPQALVLKAEILYRARQYDACLTTCRLLLDNHQQLPAITKGITHNLIGRCDQVRLRYESAFEHFNIAIEYFRPTFNLVHLCRAMVNLATSYINLEEFSKAISELAHAEELCHITGDVVAMKSIDKNRNYIHRMITSSSH